MKQKQDNRAQKRAVSDRRSFLKLAGVGAVAGGAALVTGNKPAEAAAAKPGNRLYSETDHVKAYYKLARF